MSNEEFLQEAQELIQRVVGAQTSNFLEIAKIADLNLKEDLVGADLSGFDLSNADLSNANLSDANLVGTNLSNANLSDANLVGTNLSNANLSHANLSNTNLTNANLTKADLCNVRLNNTTNLTNADLTNANLVGVNIIIADIRNAILKGSKVRHEYTISAKIVASYISYCDPPASDLRNFNQLVASLGSVNENDAAEIEGLKKFVIKIEEAQSLATEENAPISELFKEYLDKAECLDEVEVVFAYRQEIQEIEQAYRQEIQEIEQAYKACKEASIWLSSKRAELVEEARNLILENQLDAEAPSKVTVLPEQLEQFCQSINTYLLWIELYIAKGSKPALLPKEFIPSVLPANDYIKAFEFIRDNKISTGNGLSNAAVTELKGYFHRFLIKPLLQSKA